MSCYLLVIDCCRAGGAWIQLATGLNPPAANSLSHPPNLPLPSKTKRTHDALAGGIAGLSVQGGGGGMAGSPCLKAPAHHARRHCMGATTCSPPSTQPLWGGAPGGSSTTSPWRLGLSQVRDDPLASHVHAHVLHLRSCVCYILCILTHFLVINQLLRWASALTCDIVHVPKRGELMCTWVDPCYLTFQALASMCGEPAHTQKRCPL